MRLLPQITTPGAKRLIEEAGCRLLFLPPKGKHFNPIKAVFGKITSDQLAATSTADDHASQSAIAVHSWTAIQCLETRSNRKKGQLVMRFQALDVSASPFVCDMYV